MISLFVSMDLSFEKFAGCVTGLHYESARRRFRNLKKKPFRAWCDGKYYSSDSVNT